ncbi:MAG: lipid-A-disaccharide synthase N-terminal domain-containing protein [Bacteroidota bacterium]
MSNLPQGIILAIGFLAQFLFSARTFYQWFASERKKIMLTPRFFWQLSLFASFLLFAYGYFRKDFSIMLGQSITYFIYIRNLQIDGKWKSFPLISRYFFYSFPFIIAGLAHQHHHISFSDLFEPEHITKGVLFLGTIGQILFTFRFIYQWIFAEKNKQSNLPKGFWVISILGSVLILTYGVIRLDYVLILGHCSGLVIYIRNLIIIRKYGFQ